MPTILVLENIYDCIGNIVSGPKAEALDDSVLDTDFSVPPNTRNHSPVSEDI